MLAASLLSGFASAQVQTVSGTLSVAELSAGQSTTLTVSYSATDAAGEAAATTGLGLRLHYDSSVIQMDAYTERLFTGSQPFQFKDDTTDLDGDPNTDKYYLTSWADTSGAGWPVDGNTGNPLEQPLTLYVVPLTALSGYNGTTLNFTVSSSAAGYQFSSESVAVLKIPGTVSTLSDLTASYTISSGASADITIPGDLTGNGFDGKMGVDPEVPADQVDNVTVKGSYVSGDLTFARPPTGTEAPVADGWCDLGNAKCAARDLPRVGSNLYFRRFEHAKAIEWCEGQNGRLPTRQEVKDHLVPIVGDDGVFETDLAWPQQGSKYWTADLNAAGTKAFSYTPRAYAAGREIGAVLNHVTNTANLTGTPLWTICVDSASSTSSTTTITLDPAFASDVTSYSASVANPASTASIVPVLTDSFASISEYTANGTAVTANTFDVAEGSNDISITVLAEDGVGTTTYSVALTRAEAMAITLAASETVTTVNQSAYTVSGTCNVADVSVSVTFTDGSVTASSDAAACTAGAWTASADISGLSDGTITITAAGTSPGETSTVTGSANKDTQGPVVSVPADITVDAESASGTPASDAAIAAFLQAATASDATDGSVSVTNDSPDTFSVGATIVTFSAADSLGNVGTNTATVTVEDQSPPVITIEDTTIAATDAGGTAKTETAVADWLASVSSTDNVDGTVTEGITNDAPDVFPLGDTTVTFSVTDSSDLTATATAVLTITDLTAPVVSAPGSITVAATNASGTASSMSALAGDWKLAPLAGALAVGPNANEVGNWWSNDDAAVTARACLFDDIVRFGSDGSFANVMGSETWLEGWQGVEGEQCGAPVAPHDGSASATYTYDASTGSLMIEGLGSHLGLPKVYNGGEMGNPADAPASVTYTVTEMSDSAMTIQINYAETFIWQYKYVKVASSALVGDWKLSPIAGALAVGPNANEVGNWWSNDDAAVTARACLFDDVFKFGADGAFHNVMGAETWVEGWQGGGDACAAPVAPHDGSVSATYVYDADAATITVNGLGAHIGLPKVHNSGEIGAPADAVLLYNLHHL
jgi:hypothetical protein